MDLTITSLQKKAEELKEALKKVTSAIQALQEVCSHEMESDGHDSHHRYFKCKHCGKTESD